MPSTAHATVKYFDKKSSVVVNTDAFDGVAEGFNTGDHCSPCRGGVGLVFHDVSDDGGSLVAYASEKPFVAADVCSRHGSPYVEGDGMKWGGRVPAPCRLHVNSGNLGLGDGTMSAEIEMRET